MTLSIQRRGNTADGASVDLHRMLRAVDIDYRANVSHELRKRRGFVGPAEAWRLKARLARRRHARARQRAAAKAA